MYKSLHMHEATGREQQMPFMQILRIYNSSAFLMLTVTVVVINLLFY